MRSLQDRQNLAEERISQVEGTLANDVNSLRTQLQRLDNFFIAGPNREQSPFASMISEIIGTAMASTIASAVSNQRHSVSIGEQLDERERAFKDWVHATFQPRQFVHSQPPAGHTADVEMNAMDPTSTSPGYSQPQHDPGTYPRLPVESEGRPHSETLALSHREFQQAVQEGIAIAESQAQNQPSTSEVTSPLLTTSDISLPQFQSNVQNQPPAGGSAISRHVSESEGTIPVESPRSTMTQAQGPENQPEGGSGLTQSVDANTTLQPARTVVSSRQREEFDEDSHNPQSAASLSTDPAPKVIADTQGPEPMEVDTTAECHSPSQSPAEVSESQHGATEEQVDRPPVSDHATATASDVQAPPTTGGAESVDDSPTNPPNPLSATSGTDNQVDTASDNESDVSDFTFA